ISRHRILIALMLPGAARSGPWPRGSPLLATWAGRRHRRSPWRGGSIWASLRARDLSRPDHQSRARARTAMSSEARGQIPPRPAGTVSISSELRARIRADGVVVGPTVAGALRTAARYRAAGRQADPDGRATIERLEARARIARALGEAGVTVLAGTDAGVTNTP